MIASNKIYFLPVKTIPRVNSNLLVCALNKLYFVDVVCDYLEKRFFSLRIGLCWEGTWSPDKSRHTVGKKKSINVSWARFKDTDSKIKEPPSYKGQLCSWCLESEQTLLSWDEFPSISKNQLGWWGKARMAQHIMISSLSWICAFLVQCKANDLKKKTKTPTLAGVVCYGL